LWSFSNFSDLWVAYAAKGVGVNSSVPPGSLDGNAANFWAAKSGTSMAAPVITAAAAKLHCLDYEDSSLDVFGKLNVLSEQLTPLLPMVDNGRAIDVHDLIGRIDDCTFLVTSVIDLEGKAEVEFYPNPFQNWVNIRVKDSSVNFQRLLVTDALGRVLIQRSLDRSSREWKEELNLSKLMKGVYQVHLLAAEGQITQLLIKQ